MNNQVIRKLPRGFYPTVIAYLFIILGLTLGYINDSNPMLHQDINKVLQDKITHMSVYNKKLHLTIKELTR